MVEHQYSETRESDVLRLAEKAHSHSVLITRSTQVELPKGTAEISVDFIMWDLDLRKQDEKGERITDFSKPVIVFWTGFGQQQLEGDLSSIEKRIVQEGSNFGIEQFIFLSSHTIPRTKNFVLENNEHITGVMSLELLRENGLLQFSETEGFPPITLYSYSMGGAPSISLAAEICHQERIELEKINKNILNPQEHVPLPKEGKHRLIATSFTGIAESDPDSSDGLRAMLAFSREVNAIALEQVTHHLSVVKDRIEKLLETRNHGNVQTLLEEVTSIGRYIGNALQEGTDSLDNLGKVSRRLLTAKNRKDISLELKNLLQWNEDCERVGRSFSVEVRIPKDDTVQDTLHAKEALREKPEQDYGHNTRRAPWDASFQQVVANLAFINASHVSVRLVESPDGRKENHLSVMKNPERYFFPEEKIEALV